METIVKTPVEKASVSTEKLSTEVKKQNANRQWMGYAILAAYVVFLLFLAYRKLHA